MKNKLLNFKNWFQVKWEKTLILFKTDNLVSVLLASISFLYYIVLVIKCYNDINCIYIAIEYFVYGYILGIFLKKYKNVLINLINTNFIKKILTILFILGLIYVNFILFNTILCLFTGLNISPLLLGGDSSALGCSDSELNNSIDNNNNIIISENNNNIPNNTDNLNNTPNNNNNNNNVGGGDIGRHLANLFGQTTLRVDTNTTINLNNGEFSIGLLTAGFGAGVGYGIIRGSTSITQAIFNATPHFPTGTRIVTTIGVFSLLAGGAVAATSMASNLAPNVPYNLTVTNIIVPSATGTSNVPGVGSSNMSGSGGGVGKGAGPGGGSVQLRSLVSNINSSNQRDNDDLNSINMNDIIDDNLNFIDIKNSNIIDENLFSDIVNSGPMMIYSTIDETSKIENILHGLLNLEFITLGLSIMLFNMLFIRFLLLNYKEYVTKLFNILTFNKLNFDNIIRNIMVYNYKFYNIIISICLLFFIIFKLCLIFFIFNLYFKSLDYIIDYMVLNNIIIFKEDTKSVIFSSLNFLINSTLENFLLGLGINNIIIILLFLFNIILYYKNK